MVNRKDIANMAGVSVSVVSRALNNSGYVEKEKKKRIIKIAEELGYHPHSVALSLQKRRTRQLLFYCKDLQNAYNIDMYQGMIEAAKERGYMVVINGNMEFDEIKDTMIDGIIMPNEATTIHYLKSVGKNYFLPLVTASYANQDNLPKAVPLIEIDLYEATKNAIEYLRACGHKKIAFGSTYNVNINNSRTNAYISELRPILKDRIDEYYIGIDTRSLGKDERLLDFEEEIKKDTITVEENFFGKGEVAAQVFLERQLDATAILCFNEAFALGVYSQFKKMQIRIPEDISIMGFDGTHLRKYISPLLTTVNLSPKEQGAKCVEVLLDVIEGKKVKRVTHLPANILEGKSVRKIVS